jgi:hypothetical protein
LQTLLFLSAVPPKENYLQCDEGAGEQLENDALFSVAKMTEMLETGSDSQRTVILFELQQLLEHCLEETVNILIPAFCRNVHTWSYELQLSASEALLDVLQQGIDPRASKMICDAAFRVICQSHAEDMFEGWGEILVVVLPSVKWTDREQLRDVVVTLETFARDSDDVSRKLASRVLGSLAVCLTVEEVEEHILDLALTLADDIDLEVRGMIAESLAFIGAVVSVEVAEKSVWPKVLSLLKDPDARIHAATLRSLAHILEAHRERNHDSILYRELLAPVFARECAFVRRAATEDQRHVDDDTYLLLEIISEVFGQLVYAIHPFFADDAARKDAYKAFLAMATCNGPIVRRYCAFNIPGVAKSISCTFSAEVSSIVEFMSRDTDSETRWNLAAGIHETAAILTGRASIDNLFKSVSALLQDENPLVRMNTLEHFFPLLESLTQETEVGSMRRLAPVFQNLTLLSEGNWRTQELLAKQLEKACVLVPHDTLRGNVLPLLYQMSEESTYLVRKAAMPAIARALWCIPSPQARNDAVRNFRMNWAEGGVFWMRIAFLDCANAAVEFYSDGLFRQSFSCGVLRLALDPVPNVRLRLANMIHTIAPACMDTADFRDAVSALREDNDMDVKQAMEDIDERINTTIGDISLAKSNAEREKSESDLLEKMLQYDQAQAEMADAKKQRIHHHAKKFRPSALIVRSPKGKNISEQDGISILSSTAQGTSPTAVFDLNGATLKEKSVRRSMSIIATSPKSKVDAFSRRASWASLGPRLDSVEATKQKASSVLMYPPRNVSAEEDDSPRSFGMKFLSLGKKSSKK